MVLFRNRVLLLSSSLAVSCPFTFLVFLSIVFTTYLKGFGYVTFKDKEGLLKALTMTGRNLGGRNLRVEVAKPPRGGNRRGESSEVIFEMIIKRSIQSFLHVFF